MRRAAAVKARQRKLKEEAANQEDALADSSVISSEGNTSNSPGNRKGGRNRKGGAGKSKETDNENQDLSVEDKGNESVEDESNEIEEQYEVDKIIDMKVIRGVKKYRIRWKGYNSDSDTWETEENLNCPEIIKQYLESTTVQNEAPGVKNGKKRASKTAAVSEESDINDQQETLNNKDEEMEMPPPKKKKKMSEKSKSAKKENETDNEKKEKEEEYDADDDYDHDEDEGHDKEIASEDVSTKKQKVKTKTKSMSKESAATVDSETENGMKTDEPSHEEIGAKKQRVKTAKTKSVSKESEKLDENESENKTSDEAYEVEKIMEVHHKKNGKKEYLIHWRGYPHSQDSWEPEENLDCEELIREFEEKVSKAKNLNVRELRTDRAHTSRYAEEENTGNRQSKRGKGKKRATYFDAE